MKTLTALFNVNERKQTIFLISIPFGTREMRRLRVYRDSN